jgi:hypothetical protein
MKRVVPDKSKKSIWHFHPDINLTIGTPCYPMKRVDEDYHSKKGDFLGKKRKRARPKS